MRKLIHEEIVVPEDISCEYIDGVLICKSGGNELSREIVIQGTEIKVEGGKITLHCVKGNKINWNLIKTASAHIRNVLQGVKEKFTYELEICNVHFPMSVKVEGNIIKISNFLGEKVPRTAKIIKGSNVEVKGNKILVSGNDVESAGQTAANIETASKVTKKDRRVFQDGIFLISKKGRPI